MARQYTIRGRLVIKGRIQETRFLRINERGVKGFEGKTLKGSHDEMDLYLAQLKSNYPKPWQWELRDG